MYLLTETCHTPDSSYRKRGVQSSLSYLIPDNIFVFLSIESANIYAALGGYDEVQDLFNLSLIGILQEEFDQVQVIGMFSTTKLQQSVDTCFQKYVPGIG